MRFGFSIGFQLYEWEVEIEIPREYRFRSEREARTACREMKVYEKCGTLLTPEEVSELIEKGTLEEVVLFSDKYMPDGTEYMELDVSAEEAYKMLKEKYDPHYQLPFGFCSPAIKGVKGFHFESLYYQVKKI